MSKICVVASHPDDETLGCGGTLLRHKDNRDELFWIIVTSMDVKNGWKKEQVEKRRKEIDCVNREYGFKKTFNLNLPTTRLDVIPMTDIIKLMGRIMQDVGPHTVYLPNFSDIHTDHKITFQAGYSCCKSFRYPTVSRVLMYETLSETEFALPIEGQVFAPNTFVDITKYFQKKTEIMKIYKSEVMESPYPRSIDTIKALAALRGSRIGKKYAEAFNLIYEQR